MLSLKWTFTGSPSAGFQHLALTHATLILFPCARSVVILDALTLALVRVLPFWEVFPGAMYSEEHISCLSVDSGMKLIVASMNAKIAVWSLSGIQDDTWRVHSSIVLPDGYMVTTLDCKSGLLAVGGQRNLSVYTLRLEDDILRWSRKWSVTVETPSLARFAPSLMLIATISLNKNDVLLYSTTLGRQTQAIQHPRPVTAICWRHSQASSRDDLILYTITSDSILRIFLPVLDSPRRLQLHASLDIFAALPFSVASGLSSSKSTVFWLDREVVGDALKRILSTTASDIEDGQRKRLKDIQDEGWDLFLRVSGDGSIVVSAIANIDNRPPTLLRQFTLHHTLPSALPYVPSHLYLLPDPRGSTITLVTAPPLTSFTLTPAAFFDAQQSGLQRHARGIEMMPGETNDIVGFVRTPEGKAVGVMRTHGGEVWRVVDGGGRCVRTARWESADLVVVLEKGLTFATYSMSESILTLHSTPPATLSLPGITSLFSLPSEACESIIGITASFTILHIVVHSDPSAIQMLTLRSARSLPLPKPPRMILPVDPMAWSKTSYKEWGWTPRSRDLLLSVSEEGELAFWVPEESPSAHQHWKCTRRVNTGRTGFTKAVCSSTKKSALVVPRSDGEELTIWDSLESEFALGLEYEHIYSSSEPINDLDWTSTPDNQSILAVGFAHHVELLSRHCKTYFDDDPNWAVVWKIEIGSFIPQPISDSIWLSHGSLLIGAGHQMLLYSQHVTGDLTAESLFEYVARHNGPLWDYHPQMLLQCLLWEKVELVKEIIVKLAYALDEAKSRGELFWDAIPVEHFWRKDSASKSSTHPKRYTFLFNSPETNDQPEEEGFGRALVTELMDALESKPLPHLTANENAHLLVLIQTTLEIDEQRRALDANGLRFLISMRSFYILNRRASAPSSRASNGVIPRQTGRRERLRYRDMIWAFFSESQEILLQACITASNGKMCWSDARALGIAVWLNSVESLKSHLELIARNEYMAGDKRDPTACTLLYFALGKAKLVHGLWRQAAWHKEQPIMLKFLSNDFNDPRWRTAALKNAFMLLSKQRFEYAAAFFLLGGSLKGAVSVCIKQLSDVQLAIAIARVVEDSNEGPVFLSILKDTVIPLAFKNGNRWLASWAFWLLRRRDLAVRILLTPLRRITDALDIVIEEIGDSPYDDPSLALLFSQLRSKTLQAAQGTSEISGHAEFSFVLQIARVFCGMGCHALALDLVRSWSFERPSTHVRNEMEEPDTGHFDLPLFSSPRRQLFAIAPALRRQSSILIDVNVLTEPPTRRASPEPGESKPPVKAPILQDKIREEGDLFARKAGIGNLMKTAKQDVKVPEFDMDVFF